MNRRGFLAALIAAPVAAKVPTLDLGFAGVHLPASVAGALPTPTWRKMYEGHRPVRLRTDSDEWFIVWGERTVELRIPGASPSSK